MKFPSLVCLLLPAMLACASTGGGDRYAAGRGESYLGSPYGSAAEPAQEAVDEPQEVSGHDAQGAPAEAAAMEAAAADEEGELREAAVQLAEGDAVEAPDAATLSAWERRIWNDPRFQRMFVESYMADTDVEPGINAVEQDVMEEVLQLMAADELEQAEQLLKEENSEMASAVLDFTLASIYFQEERLAEAAASLELAVEKYPKFRRGWQNLGIAQFRLGDYAKVVPTLSRMVELGGGNAITYGMLGIAYANLQNPINAETAFRMAMLHDPQAVEWKRGLAHSFFVQRRFGDAVALCEVLIEEQPDRADLWLLQADAFLGLGEPMRAAENYELADSLEGSTFNSLTNLGNIYVNEKLFDMAVDAYLRGMKLDLDGEVDRALQAAKVIMAHGAIDESAYLVEGIERLRGPQLNPLEHMQLLKVKAHLALARGGGPEEAAVLEEIVALDPRDADALMLLGGYYGRAGELERAMHYLERAAEIEGYEAEAKRRLAQLLVNEDRYEEALPLLRRSQALEPRENVQDFIEEIERRVRKR